MKPSNRVLSTVRSWMKKELLSSFDEKEAASVTDLLLGQLAGIDRLEVMRSPDRELPEAEVEKLSRALERVKSSEPVQYVTGKANFRGLELVVNKKVLIPRPETEELADWAIRDNAGRKGLRIVDICTGSGCIALALCKELEDGEVTATDSSKEALEVAVINADRLGCEINFVLADILEPEEFNEPGDYDLIISNPPYVRTSEKALMDRNVLDHEPHGALFVKDDDPLVFYRAILDFMHRRMAENGYAYLEINEGLGEQVCALFASAGYGHVTLRRDLRGKDRMVRVTR